MSLPQARKAPTRALYYRRNADCDRLIQACTAKLEAEPGNARALLIRAASYTKKGSRRPHEAAANISNKAGNSGFASSWTYPKPTI